MTARLIGIVGTDTGAGKTVVTAALAVALRDRGAAVDALKPVATGVEAGSAGDDATLLAAAVARRPDECVLETYALARSPLAAAAAVGSAIDFEVLAAQIRERAAVTNAEILLIEGVGGILVPVTENRTIRDLMRRLNAPVIIAARSGLGTINHCALTVEACRNAGLAVIGIILTDVDGPVDDDLASENAEQVRRQCDVAVLGRLPFSPELSNSPIPELTSLAAHIDGAAILASPHPGEDHRRAVEADQAHVWHPFTQTSEWLQEEPLVIRSGAGCRLIDDAGRPYLDAISSLWANVHGHAHPRLDRALHEQAGRISHSTFLGQTHEPGALLAAELCAVAPGELSRVFYSDSGAEAVEVALRIAVQAQHLGRPERTRILSLDEAYHGDTAGAVSVGRSEPFHRHLDPLLFPALKAPSPFLVGEDASLAALEAILDEHGPSLAAFAVEPRVQAAAGIWPHSDGWLRRAVELVRAAGALVICDEVATGFGRTGDLFACSGAGVRPDILCLGKGLTGGYLPLAATLVTEELFDLFTAPHGEHRTLYYGHTFTANPLACAVARESLALFEREGTLDSARRLANRLAARAADLTALPLVHGVRRQGVMTGIALGGEYGVPLPASLRMGRRVTLGARQRGVIVRPLGDVVVINPPLVMTDGEADIVVSEVANAIAGVTLG